METAEHREPYESRGSRTDLGAPGGESPPGDSTSKAVPANKAECRLWVQKGDDCRNAPQRTRRAESGHLHRDRRTGGVDQKAVVESSRQSGSAVRHPRLPVIGCGSTVGSGYRWRNPDNSLVLREVIE